MTADHVVHARTRTRAALVVAAVVIIALAHPLIAQAPQPPPADPPLAFEVASVKRNRSSESGPVPIRVDWPSGRFTATAVTLTDLIRYAYRLERNQPLEGLPSWSSDRFDITAVAAEPPARPADTRGLIDRFSSAAPGGAFHDMLRTLLADRFTLVVRWETRPQPVYALVLATPDGQLGPNLRASHTDCGALEAERRAEAAQRQAQDATLTDAQRQAQILQRLEAVRNAATPEDCTLSWTQLPNQTGRRLIGGTRPLQDLIGALRLAVPDRPIVDRTGLTGSFTFDLRFAQEPAAAGLERHDPSSIDPAPPLVLAALEEQLGLRLEPQSAPVDVLVIAHIEPPDED